MKNGEELMGIVGKGWKSLGMGGNDEKLVGNGGSLLAMGENRWEWLGMYGNGWGMGGNGEE